ncbi:uncharacterized protein [Primulina eburnea]|uniref:uncharacterized protein n=1 Tax=Primulina eburnea TaxID=1245227 RepID=UPI003C6C336B
MPPTCVIDHESREARDDQRASPPRPTPDLQAQMLEEMTHFFAQFARNNAEVDRKTRPEAVYERFPKMDPKDIGGTTDPMDDAPLWWEGASVSVNLQTPTWEGFKEVFYSKYFTEEVHSRLTREFMTLRQGDNRVAEFVRKFEQGCHFVPLIANEAREIMRHFLDGLQLILRRDVRVAGPPTYAVVVTRALATEHDHKDIEIYRQGKRPPQAPQQRFQQPTKRPFQWPKREKDSNHRRRLLRNLLNIRFVRFLDVKPTRLNVSYIVTIPFGEKLSTSKEVRNLSLELHGHTVYADLIVLPMPEFDIILGMDWLSKNGVTIDFQQKSLRV